MNEQVFVPLTTLIFIPLVWAAVAAIIAVILQVLRDDSRGCERFDTLEITAFSVLWPVLLFVAVIVSPAVIGMFAAKWLFSRKGRP